MAFVKSAVVTKHWEVGGEEIFCELTQTLSSSSVPLIQWVGQVLHDELRGVCRGQHHGESFSKAVLNAKREDESLLNHLGSTQEYGIYS